MWIAPSQIRKWRPDSIEARIYAVAEAEAHARGEGESAADAGIQAVFEVLSWLYSRPYAVVRDLVLDRYGVETSEAALSGFWSRFAGSWLAERNARNGAAARLIAQETQLGPLTDATMELIAQQALEIMSSPAPDATQVRHFAKLLLQREKQAVDERKVALLEEKAAQAKREIEAALAGAKAKGGGLTEETLRRIEEAANLL